MDMSMKSNILVCIERTMDINLSPISLSGWSRMVVMLAELEGKIFFITF